MVFSVAWASQWQESFLQISSFFPVFVEGTGGKIREGMCVSFSGWHKMSKFRFQVAYWTWKMTFMKAKRQNWRNPSRPCPQCYEKHVHSVLDYCFVHQETCKFLVWNDDLIFTWRTTWEKQWRFLSLVWTIQTRNITWWIFSCSEW